MRIYSQIKVRPPLILNERHFKRALGDTKIERR